ncbi:hypothetical protein BpHYR1_026371 [Brachionus plicatilis]|uniref:Uncharacterized protein n=1 Tax=Brachionus plicatilis TaxID=10195 RepID=A0A3M7SE31_BRAPC|nr:hypothetical protein BpHYR1_026371 [Brachionus plicatilis]
MIFTLKKKSLLFNFYNFGGLPLFLGFSFSNKFQNYKYLFDLLYNLINIKLFIQLKFLRFIDDIFLASVFIIE